MADTVKNIKAVISAEDRTGKGIDSASNSLRKLEKDVVKLVAGYFAFSKVSDFINSSIESFRRQEEEVARLSAALSNVATARETDLQMLKMQASALQQVTKFGDEQIMSAQAMLATFQLNGDAISQLTPRILDMASGVQNLTGGQVDLQQISIAVGKALTSGIGILSRYGVVLTEAQKKAYETANAEEKLNIITEALDMNYKGIASTMANTLSGKIVKLTNNFDDLKEKIGEAITLSMVPWINTLDDGITAANKTEGELNDLAYILSYVSQFLFDTGKAIQVFFMGIGAVILDTADLVTFRMIPSLHAMRDEAYSSIGDVINKTADAQAEFKDMRQRIINGESALNKMGTSGSQALENINETAEETKKKLADVAVEAKKLADKMNEVLVEQAEGELDIKQKTAEAYVKQEEKVADLRKQLATETDETKRAEIEATLQKQTDALEKAKTIEIAYSNEVADVRRFNAQTEFEQELEKLQIRRINFQNEITEKISGIQKEIEANKTKVDEITKLSKIQADDAIANSNRATNAIIDNYNKEIDAATKSRIARATSITPSSSSPIANLLSGAPLSYSPRASGGPVSAGRSYLVGERGPELFMPNVSGSISPNGGITINITGNEFVGEEGIADRLGKEIMRAIKANIKL